LFALINKNAPNQIIIVGHNPLLTCKNKKDEYKTTFIHIHNDTDNQLYMSLLNCIADNNGIYMCADTHNFQVGKYTFKHNGLNKSFFTVICGTGGAHLDNLCKQSTTSNVILEELDYSHKLKASDSSSSKIRFNGYGIKSYGYSKFEFKDNILNVDFISLLIPESKKHVIKKTYKFELNNNISKDIKNYSLPTSSSIVEISPNLSIDFKKLMKELDEKNKHDICFAYLKIKSKY